MSKNFYETLGVQPDAEEIVIRAAYRALAQRYHPDRWVGDKREAHARMSAINEAYETLSDAAKRQHYDGTIGSSSYSDQSAKSNEKEPSSQPNKQPPQPDWIDKILSGGPVPYVIGAGVFFLAAVLWGPFKNSSRKPSSDTYDSSPSVPTTRTSPLISTEATARTLRDFPEVFNAIQKAYPNIAWGDSGERWSLKEKMKTGIASAINVGELYQAEIVGRADLPTHSSGKASQVIVQRSIPLGIGSYDCHACSSIVGVYVLNAEGNSVYLKAGAPFVTTIGQWGRFPNIEPLQIQPIGDGVSVLLLSDSDMGQGVTIEQKHFIILFNDKVGLIGQVVTAHNESAAGRFPQDNWKTQKLSFDSSQLSSKGYVTLSLEIEGESFSKENEIARKYRVKRLFRLDGEIPSKIIERKP